MASWNKGIHSDPAPRFWAKVRPTGFCWEWVGASDRKGYGAFKPEQARNMRAHRYAYELLIGPIPEGAELDHLCRNPGCVNPDHLEPVTTAENLRRGFSFSGIKARATHCVHGHVLAGDNLAIRPDGSRECVPCKQRRRKERNDRLKRQRANRLAG